MHGSRALCHRDASPPFVYYFFARRYRVLPSAPPRRRGALGGLVAGMEIPSLNADSIAAIVQLLPLAQRYAVARVSTCWRCGALLALESATKLDLRSHAKTLNDLQLAQLLARSPNIIDLNLHGCTLLTDTALDKVAQYCSHLVAINISCVPGVGADAVERMCGSMVGLQSLDLGGCRSISKVDLVSRFGKYMDLGEEDGLDQVQG